MFVKRVRMRIAPPALTIAVARWEMFVWKALAVPSSVMERSAERMVVVVPAETAVPATAGKTFATTRVPTVWK